MATKTLPKSSKLLNALTKAPRTVGYISSKLNIPNPAATISYLRQKGHCIVTLETGTITKYAII
jgi:hypothetical protein